MELSEAFDILGLDNKATEEEIKKQYRSLVKAGNHPDHCSTYFEKARAAKKFQKLTEAKNILISYCQQNSSQNEYENNFQFNNTTKTNSSNRKKEDSNYNYHKGPKEEFSDKLWDKIFPGGWFGELFGILLLFPLFIFALTAGPVSFGLNYLFIKIGIEPEEGLETIGQHFVANTRQTLSFLLGGYLAYLFFIMLNKNPEWFDVYIVFGYLIFWFMVSLVEWLSFFYYINFLRKHKKRIGSC